MHLLTYIGIALIAIGTLLTIMGYQRKAGQPVNSVS